MPPPRPVGLGFLVAGPPAGCYMSRMPKREIVAAALALLVGAPLMFLFARSVTAATVRYEETPLRAMLGDDRYDALKRGEGGFPHYMGDDRRAPDFTLEDRNGTPWTLSDHRGHVVVLNFWSIDCPPCIRELPSIDTLAEIAAGWGDVDVVAVSIDRGWDAVKAIVPEPQHATYLFDPSQHVVHDLYGTQLFPETWIIDKQGVVRLRYDGGLNWASPVVLDAIKGFR